MGDKRGSSQNGREKSERNARSGEDDCRWKGISEAVEGRMGMRRGRRRHNGEGVAKVRLPSAEERGRTAAQRQASHRQRYF